MRDSTVVGPLATMYAEWPESDRDAMLDVQVQAIHIRPMGICLHHLATDPCPYHLNCAWLLRFCPP